MLCLRAYAIPYIVVGVHHSIAIPVIDTLTDTLTVQNGPGIADARGNLNSATPSLEPQNRTAGDLESNALY